ncbi:C4-dicarboxylate transporter/malic acid transport protein-like protein [Plenodomus tracheiphilus IPT5]|uniref:C4-dicarboxylate transporter/malic acid transport protein-like protein n=1 Tax=Plenodomus tracheiphilus IPT5 TaxID=1408161 RepID=A0A6A7BKM4_9PLEO|nr:C4-dicarboxylate transporter/malic acid transport protein-like protein [Plenodomus tracheiphilus IPT5]
MSEPRTTEEASLPKPVVMRQGRHKQNDKTGIRQRLKHFTFAWFLSTMSTGGLAIALAETPHKFTARYLLHPKHFLASFTHPAESFFLGSFFLSLSVIIGGIQSYGITHGPAYPWLLSTLHILYWLYAALSLINSIFQYWILISHSTVRPIPYLPSIFLAGYSAMLTGTIGSLIAGSQPVERRVAIVASGVAYQGFGWCISFIAIVSCVRNLLDQGLPPPGLRPGMFIPVGSCAYTVVALIGLANALPSTASTGYLARHPAAVEILRVMALFVGIFLWLFAFWLFVLAVLGNVVVVGKMPFSLSWWAFIFPNVGFMLSTSIIGKELESEAILWVASVMTILLVGVWIVTTVGCVRATWKRKIVWLGEMKIKVDDMALISQYSCRWGGVALDLRGERLR